MSLDAISVLDGRYAERLQQLSPILSERGLIEQRIRVEVQLLIQLVNIGVADWNGHKRQLSEAELNWLNELPRREGLAERVKEIEQTTRHDVKAVEMAIRELFKGSSLQPLAEMIHFAVTSEDINNLAYRLQIKEAISVVSQQLQQLLTQLAEVIEQTAAVPMLARTHGQPAVGTTLGKELAVFYQRLLEQSEKLGKMRLGGKINGAVGNYNSFYAYDASVNWLEYSQTVIEALGLEPVLLTTQINVYEDVTELLQICQRINLIVVDLDQDMWRYISDEYFSQSINKGEVGSSVMSHKVNPIDFENSEANALLSNSLIEGLVRKLPISRLQRDLSDSSSVRNVGSALAYSSLALTSAQRGLSRVQANEQKMLDDLLSNWSVLSEAVQTILRAEGVEDAYQKAATMTKGKQLSKSDYQQWVQQLDVSDEVSEKLLKLSPDSYLGIAEQLAQEAIRRT